MSVLIGTVETSRKILDVTPSFWETPKDSHAFVQKIRTALKKAPLDIFPSDNDKINETIKEVLFQTKIVTLEEFTKTFEECIHILQEKLEANEKWCGFRYSDTEKATAVKSSDWLFRATAERIHPEKKPCCYNDVHDLHDFMSMCVKEKITSVVYIDDAVFSGEQFRSVIRSFRSAFLWSELKIRLLIVIPYWSACMQKTSHSGDWKPSGTNIEIMTPRVLLPTIETILDDLNVSNEMRKDVLDVMHRVPEFCFRCTLAVFEHKLADDTSIPVVLYVILKDVHLGAPYKNWSRDLVTPMSLSCYTRPKEDNLAA